MREREDVGGARDGDDAVDGAQPGGEGFVVFCGGEDEFGEALYSVGWIFGEAGAKGLGDVVELLDQEVGDGVCGGSLRRWEGFNNS